jgi:hypothetical protein
VIPHDHPLFEFDPAVEAVINPWRHRAQLGFPDRAVMCWFGDVVRSRTTELEPVDHVPFEHGAHAVYVVNHRGVDVALTNPPVGAPASVGSLEVLIALGATNVIGCGERASYDLGSTSAT